jgi:lipoate-protein ligase A
MREWRLIVDGDREGAENMALDWSVLEAYERGEAASTVRLYGWRAPTASLGKFQRLEDVDLEACRAYGVELCRRPTGGRGVLHDDEITYSIVTGVRDGLPRGVAASYRVLCQGLASAYQAIGIDAHLTARARGVATSGACYLHATQADLSLGAAKLSGSAQVWLRDACLQHGSFVVSRDVAREAAVFRLSQNAADELASATQTIESALGERGDPEMLRAAIVSGIAEGLGVRLVQGDFTAAEIERAMASVSTYRVA